MSSDEFEDNQDLNFHFSDASDDDDFQAPSEKPKTAPKAKKAAKVNQ
jgi:hypothetical protein